MGLTFGVLLTTTTTAQTTDDYWKQRYQILEENDGIATVLDNVNGRTFLWRISPPKELVTGERLDTLYADTTIYINLNQIDTTLFSERFYVLGTVPIYNRGLATLVYDSDGNGLSELIGYYKELGTYDVYNRFYEWDPQTQSFEMVVDFGVVPQIKGGRAILGFDIDQDGYKELYLGYGDSLRVYEATANNQYATHYRYSHYRIPIEPSGHNAGDFDNDGKLELALMGSKWDSVANRNLTTCIIQEHVRGDTTFKEIANIAYPPENLGSGNYAIDDIDLDGHIEIFRADLNGRIYGIENVANDSFRLHYQAQLPTLNADFHIAPGDLDKDGRPELFMGGNHNGLTYVTMIEATGNDTYHAELAWAIYPGSGIYMDKFAVGDVDGDGEKELVLNSGSWVLVFKGVKNNTYELFWAKFFLWADGMSLGDVDGDGVNEIVLSQAISVGGGDGYSKSRIYKFDDSSMYISNLNHTLPNSITIYQNYPNPFNSRTFIEYDVSTSGIIKIKIFDISGKEVVTLRDEYQLPDAYTVEWDGRNKAGREVASGIYLLRIIAGNQQEVLKILLVR